MSSPALDFLRRVRSLDQQLGSAVGPPDVARVDIVSDRSYMGSRERAPVAYHHQTVGVGGAGVHNGFILGATDLVGGKARLLVHNFYCSSSVNVLVAVVPANSITYASGPTLVEPVTRDADPEVIPLISWFTIAAVNIPALLTPGWAFPYIPESSCLARGTVPLPAIEMICPDKVLIVLNNSANEATGMRALWQAVRI